MYVESIRALLAYRSKNLIEIVRSSYFPRLKSQPERTRRDWDNLIYCKYSGHTRRIVEKRDTCKSRNRFFEQLQPLPAYFCAKICNPSDVAAGTGKAIN